MVLIQSSFIALSGLGGHAFGSFKSRGGDFMWLRDDLPYSIPNAGIFIYGYDTRLQGSTSLQCLEDLGLSFKDALLSLLGESLKSNRMKVLVLLGHSLGGLIVKEVCLVMHWVYFFVCSPFPGFVSNVCQSEG